MAEVVRVRERNFGTRTKISYHWSYTDEQAFARTENLMLESVDASPLPQATRSDELETLGKQALANAIPVSRFETREVPKDKGVDGTLELKSNGLHTNL